MMTSCEGQRAEGLPRGLNRLCKAAMYPSCVKELKCTFRVVLQGETSSRLLRK